MDIVASHDSLIDLRSLRGGPTAQAGENAVLDLIFETIGTTNKFCVDCGAFDLTHLSNVHPLWKERGWSALLIEGNPFRCWRMDRTFRKMKARGEANGRVTVVHRYAQDEGKDSLDSILDERGAPLTPDLLSIDIDGNDFEVWKGLVRHRPRVLVIEYNSSIPAHISLIGGPGNYIGASARALLDLGRSKSYDLVAATEANLIFVDATLSQRFAFRNDLHAHFDSSQTMYAFQTYDGAIVLAGPDLVFRFNPFSRYVSRIAHCDLPVHPLPSSPSELIRIWGRGLLIRSARESVRAAFRLASPVVGLAMKKDAST